MIRIIYSSKGTTMYLNGQEIIIPARNEEEALEIILKILERRREYEENSNKDI